LPAFQQGELGQGGEQGVQARRCKGTPGLEVVEMHSWRCFFKQLVGLDITPACMAIPGRYNAKAYRNPFPRAEVAKSVDAVDSKSTVAIRAGSSPAFGTIYLYSSSNFFRFVSVLNMHPLLDICLGRWISDFEFPLAFLSHGVCVVCLNVTKVVEITYPFI
jgi:hypothetical protein